MIPIAHGSLMEVGDIPVDDGAGKSHTYGCAAVIVFDSVIDLRNAIKYGEIKARYRDESREEHGP